MLHLRDSISASHTEDGEVSELQISAHNTEAGGEQEEIITEVVTSDPLCFTEDERTQEVCRSSGGTTDLNLTKQKANAVSGGTEVETSAEDQDEAAPDVVNESLDRKAETLIDGEWIISSKAFIGPMCRPEGPNSNSDLEDKLSEFYKELEEIKDLDSSSTDKDESCVEFQKSISSAPRKEERFNFNRGHRPDAQPHMFGDSRGDDCRPWKRRRHYNGPDDGVWDPRFYQDPWQQQPPFGCPDTLPCPWFSERPLYEPFPPPVPTGPFCPPDFRAHMSTYYNCPQSTLSMNRCGGQHPCPPGTQFSFYDRYGDHGSFQGYGEGPCPPYDFGNGQGNGLPSCADGTWSQLCGQGGPDWNRSDGDSWPHQRSHSGRQRHPPPLSKNNASLDGPLVLILMRGLPGSGKSTLARELLSASPNGTVLSTDDYFSGETGYAYDPTLLGKAHDWNHNRARNAMDDGRSPVIIDNTNTQAWEMKPYAEMAVERGYHVDFCEPNTTWKLDPAELEKRNKHRVPRQKIEQMLQRFELPVTLDIVLNSQQPPHKSVSHSSTQLRPRSHDIQT